MQQEAHHELQKIEIDRKKRVANSLLMMVLPVGNNYFQLRLFSLGAENT